MPKYPVVITQLVQKFLKKIPNKLADTEPANFLDAKKNNKINSIPSNHSPKFAPVIHPTLKTRLLAMMTAAVAWFDKS